MGNEKKDKSDNTPKNEESKSKTETKETNNEPVDLRTISTTFNKQEEEKKK